MFKTRHKQFYFICRSPLQWGPVSPYFLHFIFFPFQAATEPDADRRAYAGEEQGLRPGVCGVPHCVLPPDTDVQYGLVGKRGFSCHPWNKLPGVATRATEPPCEALGGGRAHFGPVGQPVGKVRGGKGSHGLDAGAVLVPSANVATARGVGGVGASALILPCSLQCGCRRSCSSRRRWLQ